MLGQDDERLGDVLDAQRGAGSRSNEAWVLGLNVAPRMYQTVLLETLAAGRALGHHRNLVVAATGTGKTWVAAVDYVGMANRAGAPPHAPRGDRAAGGA